MLAAVGVGVGWLAGASQAQARTASLTAAQSPVGTAAAGSCARTAVIGVANKIANQVTATTGKVAGRNGRAAVGTALVAVGRTGVFSVLPCDPRTRKVNRLAAIAGLPGLSTASGVLSVADAAGVAAGSGMPGLPDVTDLGDMANLAHRPNVPGLPDASSLVTLPDLPGVPLLPGTPKSPAPNLVLAKGMPGELSGLAAGIPSTSGLPAAPAVPKAPAVPAEKLLPPASFLPETAALPDAPDTVTEIAESLLNNALIP